MEYVFDIETDGINATKIHCLSYCTPDSDTPSTFVDYEDMKKFLLQDGLTLIGHNIVRYDIPMLERMLGIKIKARLIDTLPLSWYLEPNRMKHGLEGYGEDFGVPKPKIDDWENLSIEEYSHRCEEDVRINNMLWEKQYKHLRFLYSSKDEIKRLIEYLTFKMDCVREQEEVGLHFDQNYCRKILAELEEEKAKKIAELTKAMPKVAIYAKRSVPKVLYKSNGELSARGEEWFKLLKEMDLPVHTQEVKIIKEWEDGNPNSSEQIKAWVSSLGWVPQHIKHVRNKEDGSIKQIPQIASKQGGGEICDSIKLLIEKEPSLALLEGLSVMSHRIGIFKAFLEDHVENRLYATCAGLTNTLRLQHSVVVNLPSVERKYGKEIRSCIIADSACVLCGSDLSGIEDNTKRHYIYKFDPKYVEEMNTPGYDPHLEIAMLAGFITAEQVQAHKEGKENHKKSRQLGKVVNFSATYKVGAETLARNSGLSLKEAKDLLKVYWQRNKAILDVEKELEIKEFHSQKWLLNPVSGFWYSLRAEKDRFSTLNQGTAVYVFDVWVMYLRQLGVRIGLQYHDEVLFNIKQGLEQRTQDVIDEAIRLTNEKLKLNIKVACSAQWGKNYAECH